MASRKHQPSSIDRLPEEIRDQIADLRQRRGKTIDEIMTHLALMNVEVSRSAVGRHVKSMAEIGESLRKSQAMAKFVVEEFGGETDDRVGRANIALLQGALLEIITERPTDDDGAPITLGAEEAKAISLSLQRLISSQRMDADRQLRLRKDAREEMAKEAAAVVDNIAKREGGLTRDTIAAIKAEILGIKP